MKLRLSKPTTLSALILTLGFSAWADTVSITFVGSATGVNDGADYVLPYRLKINGTITNATCFDIFDNVSPGQSWTANLLTVSQAAATGQFTGDADAPADYHEVGFLSQQAYSSPQDQIDLQHAIWNVFAPGMYPVTPGMQAYLDLLATPAYAAFDFSRINFLEDVNQGAGRAQAFVIDPPATPEPGTIVMAGAAILLIAIGRMRGRSGFAPCRVSVRR